MPLCAWGADVLAIDLPDDAVWLRVRELARRGAGTVRMPVSSDGTTGVDIVADLPAAHAWLTGNLNGAEPVLGMHAYADGGAHVLLTGAFDALSTAVTAKHPSSARHTSRRRPTPTSCRSRRPNGRARPTTRGARGESRRRR